MPLQRFLQQVSIAKESAWGTAATASTADQFVAATNVKMDDIIEPIYDEGYRGLASKDFAVNQGFRHSTFEFEFQPMQLNTGNFLVALLGGVDTVTGANPPNIHTIPQLNTGLPPSYSLTHYDATAATARQITGAYLTQLDITQAGTGELKCKAMFVGKYSGTVTKPTATYDTLQPFLPWQNAPLVNASSVVGARVIALNHSFKRPVEMIPGFSGTQDATIGNVGPLEATGTLTMYVIDSTDINLYRNNTQGQLRYVWTASTSQILQLNMNVVAFENGTVLDTSKEYLTLSAKYCAIYNSTDAGTMAAVLTTAGKATAY